ncbi:WD40 repeat domain-containing protein [Catellatospora tritici]|uniref:WD40 repeat domain-containing protein n=1 Tax=Catellatospora tritici TaxID=2851566 RepID=UPI001C2CC678|nr:hypothetical protein [Catellatospora tritici]MBV1853513.1 hypothetical protein [Catellatospora tritici]
MRKVYGTDAMSAGAATVGAAERSLAVVDKLALPHPEKAWRLEVFHTSDGRPRLVSGGSDVICVWDPVSGEQLVEYEAEIGWFGFAVCRPDGGEPLVALGTEDGVEWFDAETGRAHSAETCPDQIWDVTAIRMPDGTETLFGAGYSHPHPIHRWDASTRKPLPQLGEHSNHIVAVAACTLPDGNVMVAATGWARTIHRWDPVTGTELGPPLAGHRDIVHWMDTVDVPGRGLLFLSGDFGNVVRRWDAVTGEAVGELIKVHSGLASVRALTVAGRPQLLTSSEDRVIRRWDALTGELLGEPGTGLDPVVLSVGGELVVAACEMDHVTVQPLRLC